MSYSIGQKVFDKDLPFIEESKNNYDVRDVRKGCGVGVIKDVYSENSFIVKFENEDMNVYFSESGQRYDREGLKGSEKLQEIEQSQISLRYRLSKILNTDKIENYLKAKDKLNITKLTNEFKDEGYSPTLIKKYISNIINKNIEILDSNNISKHNGFIILENDKKQYMYDYILSLGNKDVLKDYIVYLKEYYKEPSYNLLNIEDIKSLIELNENKEELIQILKGNEFSKITKETVLELLNHNIDNEYIEAIKENPLYPEDLKEKDLNFNDID